MSMEMIGNGGVTNTAERQFVDGWLAMANKRIEAGQKVSCFCNHCDQEIEYPGTIILIASHIAETNEPLISTLHEQCHEDWRRSCAEALAKL